MKAEVCIADRAANRSWLDIGHVNSRRALLLMALGALTGLVLAGLSLFVAKETSTLIVPPEDVALVNQQPISRSDFMANLKTLFGADFAHSTAAQRQRVLHDMIREELFVQRAKELDLASTDLDVRAAMVNAVEQQAAADAITSLPGDAQLAAYYEAHKERYSSEGSMVVRDLVFAPSAMAAATSAAAALQTGAPADLVIGRFGGRDSGKVSGEEFYFAAKIHLGDRLFGVAKGLANGAASSPIAQPDGIHLLQMVENKPPVPLGFDRARERVLSDFRGEAAQRLQTGDEKFLTKRANILIAKDVR